jgi:hypothetical protein
METDIYDSETIYDCHFVGGPRDGDQLSLRGPRQVVTFDSEMARHEYRLKNYCTLGIAVYEHSRSYRCPW